ncbi:hypothetical protein GIB67_018997 [Kingdonia uniflora]|uniref:Protein DETOXIFICATION n=1 Tax=Kingdonia uniflora TaxID=39325 RepID=A0A7J7MZW1_9MAGN|nr:hypothetical protein GIB67_018997 [Kingdonia uniflora]
MSTISTFEETSREKLPPNLRENVFSELGMQRGISIPLIAMNLTWFLKITVTMAFLGRLGELQLAGGALGFTFANVTGYSVLNGLCCAMEPICGQAYGAKNYKLLHKTLFMATLLLLVTTIPVAFMWLNVDKILIYFGQQRDISIVAKNYLFLLLPDLFVTAFLAPLKAYLISQSIAIPIMVSSALGLAFHILFNILLWRAKGLQGVAVAVWLTDLIIVILLALYVVLFRTKWREGGWCDQELRDWTRLLRLSCPCCLTTCLEWWCYEILVLLTGRLPDPKRAVSVITVVLNFDYLLYSFMQSLATCTSTRVSNELGANRAKPAYRSACVSLVIAIVMGCIGGSVMVLVKSVWGSLFSRDTEVLRGVKKIMKLMAVIELVNFPLVVCGGIVRGMARLWLGMYANIAGFYMLALPLGVVMAFKVGLKLTGLLLGFLVGMIVCLIIMLVFLARVDWDEEAKKAQQLSCVTELVGDGDGIPKSETC